MWDSAFITSKLSQFLIVPLPERYSTPNSIIIKKQSGKFLSSKLLVSNWLENGNW